MTAHVSRTQSIIRQNVTKNFYKGKELLQPTDRQGGVRPCSPELILRSKEGEAMNQSKPKILILLYSMYGHIFSMTNAVAEGVREEGGEAVLKQVAELVPEQYWDENVKKAKELMKDIPVADPRKDLKGIDGLIVGTPTRFGNMTS